MFTEIFFDVVFYGPFQFYVMFCATRKTENMLHIRYGISLQSLP